MLRISGPGARAIGAACFRPLRPDPLEPRSLRRGVVHDPITAERLDDALAAVFVAPHSYTGEDVVELYVHGGSGVVAACLTAVLKSGARLAAPGEFTRRAFVNGRIDLAQAEAVADVINAQTRLAAKAAAGRLEGSLGRALRDLRAELTARLVEIEAHVDYPDEVPPPELRALCGCLRAQKDRVAAYLAGAGAAQALRDGIDCVIAGPPNAGKSSLLNGLLDAERAIVSEVPGTTRDIVEDRLAVDGVILRLKDTAGLRATADRIEAEGVARAQRAIADAALVIVVIDISKPLEDDERTAISQTLGLSRIVLGNKQDLGDAGLQQLHAAVGQERASEPAVLIAGSVWRRETIDEVRSAVAYLGWGGATLDASTALIANGRQIEALARAGEALDAALETIEAHLPIDLLSGDLRAAVAAYGELTGQAVSEEIIDGIFSRFCVGK